VIVGHHKCGSVVLLPLNGSGNDYNFGNGSGSDLDNGNDDNDDDFSNVTGNNQC
jgi:hypothetical protein